MIKNKNVSAQVEEGLEEIKQDKELIIFTTDKTGTFSADTVENYTGALKPHVQNDIKIDTKKVRDNEKKCNHHMKQLSRCFVLVPPGATRVEFLGQQQGQMYHLHLYMV